MRARTEESRPLKPNPLDAGLCLLFLAFWIVPLMTVNLTKRKIPFYPGFMAALTSTSNLFTKANYLWPVPYIQVQTREGGVWETLKEEDYFRMPTFGYRTRLFEALYLATDDPHDSAGIQKEIARWVAREYAARTGRVPFAVRFVAGLQRARPGERIDGPWRTPPLQSFAPSDVYELSRHPVTTEAAGLP